MAYRAYTKGENMNDQLVVRTSQAGWLAVLAKAYKDKTPVLVIDDAKVGIDPSNQSLFEMGRKANLSKADIAAACVAVGMAVAGVVMVVLAFVDPEPTTKLALLFISGAVLAFTGGHQAIRILTKVKPPKITVKGGGFEFEIKWE
jgi:hypothetical protein